MVPRMARRAKHLAQTLAIGAAAAAVAVAFARPPAAATATCAITDHGASTASGNNTAAIAAAIAACAGGGTVVVAGGAFKTGPLVIANTQGVTIEIQQGAALEAAFGPDDWPKIDGGYQDFIVFQNCNNCGLIGGGSVLGKGGRPPFGFDWYYLFDKKKIDSRPMLIVVQGGGGFTLSGVTLLDAPQFNVALDGVAGAEISGLNITSTWYVSPFLSLLLVPD